MKIKKALHRYFREQVDAVTIDVGIPRIKTNGHVLESRMFNVAFHAVLIALILMAMISGHYQPALLEKRVLVITENYNIDERVTKFLDDMVREIKNNRSEGGGL